MIDFTNAPQRNKLYAGTNGGKLSIIYQAVYQNILVVRYTKPDR